MTHCYFAHWCTPVFQFFFHFFFSCGAHSHNHHLHPKFERATEKKMKLKGNGGTVFKHAFLIEWSCGNLIATSHLINTEGAKNGTQCLHVRLLKTAVAKSGLGGHLQPAFHFSVAGNGTTNKSVHFLICTLLRFFCLFFVLSPVQNFLFFCLLYEFFGGD